MLVFLANIRSCFFGIFHKESEINIFAISLFWNIKRSAYKTNYEKTFTKNLKQKKLGKKRSNSQVTLQIRNNKHGQNLNLWCSLSFTEINYIYCSPAVYGCLQVFLTAWKVPKYGVFLVRFLLHSDQKKRRIWTLFTQRLSKQIVKAW